MYTKARNWATKLLRANHEEFEMHIILSGSTSQKMLWKYVNRNKPNLAPSLSTFTHLTAQLTIDNDFEKAHIFNETFVSVLLSQNQYLHILKYQQHRLKLLHPLMIHIFHTWKCLGFLENYSSKSPDEDVNELIKKIAAEIAGPLTFIFNLSFAHGLCPSGWKKH